MTSPDAVNDAQFGPMKPYFPHRGSPAKRAQPTQGKLFQEGPPQGLARYPRGYTPERMGEVRKATDPLINQAAQASLSLTGARLDSPYNVPQGRRLAQEAIARSDVPTKHLKGLGRISLRSGMRPGLEGQLGSYTPASRAIDIEPQPGDLTTKRGVILTGEQARKKKGASRRQAQPVFDAALLHEIGHHVDFGKRFPEGLTEEETAQEVGRIGGRGFAEGKADRYMLERFRNDPRNQRRTGFDVGTSTYGAKGMIYRGYPKDLIQQGQAVAQRVLGAEAERKQTNLNRKAAAQKARTQARQYRQASTTVGKGKNIGPGVDRRSIREKRR